MADRSFRPEINPALIVWARTHARKSHADLAKACHTTDEIVAAWEVGAPLPTLTQLTRIAEICKRPLATFFLPDPPADQKPPKALRSLGSKGVDTYTAPTALAVRAALRSQDIIRELREAFGSTIPPVFPRLRVDGDPEEFGMQFRDRLNLPLDQQMKWRDEGTALREWRTRIEALGILTMQVSFPLDEGRGFSIYDADTPVIVLNSTDAATARCFTLMHEVAHLGLKQSGIFQPCRLFDGMSSIDRAEEYFCNRFAAAVLVPVYENDIDQLLEACFTNGVVDEAAVIRSARQLRVSRFVILRKLWSENRISLDTVHDIEDAWGAAYKATPVPPKKDKSGVRIRPEVKCLSQKGRRYIGTIFEGLDRDIISYAQASDYLGLKTKNFTRLREKVGGYEV